MASNHSSSDLPIRQELKLLAEAHVDDKPRLFSNYCRKVIKDKNRGNITLEEAAYQIAGTMFVGELDNPLFEEITSLAGSLELPGHVTGIDPRVEWKRLVSLVDEYADNIGKMKSTYAE